MEFRLQCKGMCAKDTTRRRGFEKFSCTTSAGIVRCQMGSCEKLSTSLRGSTPRRHTAEPLCMLLDLDFFRLSRWFLCDTFRLSHCLHPCKDQA